MWCAGKAQKLLGPALLRVRVRVASAARAKRQSPAAPQNGESPSTLATLTPHHKRLAMPISRAAKRAAASKARQRRYRRAAAGAAEEEREEEPPAPAGFVPTACVYDEDTEDAEDYRAGGYHPVAVRGQRTGGANSAAHCGAPGLAGR